jgi:hypothetical protein
MITDLEPQSTGQDLENHWLKVTTNIIININTTKEDTVMKLLTVTLLMIEKLRMNMTLRMT